MSSISAVSRRHRLFQWPDQIRQYTGHKRSGIKGLTSTSLMLRRTPDLASVLTGFAIFFTGLLGLTSPALASKTSSGRSQLLQLVYETIAQVKMHGLTT